MFLSALKQKFDHMRGGVRESVSRTLHRVAAQLRSAAASLRSKLSSNKSGEARATSGLPGQIAQPKSWKKTRVAVRSSQEAARRFASTARKSMKVDFHRREHM